MTRPRVGRELLGGEVVVHLSLGEHVRQRIHVRDAVRREHEYVLVGAEPGWCAERVELPDVGAAGETQTLRRAAVLEDGDALALDREGEAVHLAGTTRARRCQYRIGCHQVQRAALVVLAPAAPVVRHVVILRSRCRCGRHRRAGRRHRAGMAMRVASACDRGACHAQSRANPADGPDASARAEVLGGR